MVLRKIKNLRPGDIIIMHGENKTVTLITKGEFGGHRYVHTSKGTHTMNKKDLVEVFIM